MRLTSIALWATFLLLSATAPTPRRVDDDPEIVQEFRRYYKKYKDTPSRVEAVLALEGTDEPVVVDTLVPILADAEPDVARAAQRVFSAFKTRPPVERLLAVLAENKTEPVRIGILGAFASARYPDTQGAVFPLLADASWSVRRMALTALAAGGDPSIAPSLVPLCSDPEAAVRSDAIEAVLALQPELALQPAIVHLSDAVWQVRATCVKVLHKVRHRDGVGALVEQLAREDGRLRGDIAVVLEALTAQFDLGQDVKKWQEYWAGAKDSFRVLTDADVEFLRKKRKEILTPRTGSGGAAPELISPAEKIAYHSIQTPSRSILFVIDVSGSMEQEVVDRERYKDGGYPSFLRIDIVKTELVRTLEKLEPFVKFNVLAFATEVKEWKKDLVSANVLNKSSAVSWVNKLESIGGSSKSDLAEVGLAGSANLEMGKTNTYGALMEALSIKGPRTGEQEYLVEADTVFFLSDGRPSHGEYVDTDDILREVRTANQLRKMVIHAIAIGEFEKDFMRRLAEENGGVFVDLGK